MKEFTCKIKTYLPAPVLFLLGILIYSDILHAPFLFDDILYIADNAAIRNLENFLTPSGTRYLTFLTFALNYAASGYDTFGYHIVNVLIHIFNGFLLYNLVQLLFKSLSLKNKCKDAVGPLSWKVGFFASVIFLVHPMQTQAVSYISQRFASLAVLFYLLSIAFYLKARVTLEEGQKRGGEGFKHWFFYAFAVLTAFTAQKTKETAFTLPAVIALLEFVFFDWHKARWRRFVYLLPFFLAFAVIPLSLFGQKPPHGESLAGIAEELRRYQIEEMATLSRHDYFVTQMRVIVSYLRLMLLPVNQHARYDFPMYDSMFAPPVLLSAVFLLLMLSSGVYLLIRSRKRYAPCITVSAFGILWFFITISVESSIIPIKDVFFEHRVYLPSVGLIAAFASAFFFAVEKIKKRPGLSALSGPGAWAVMLVIVVILSAAAYRRNAVWRDKDALSADILKEKPGTAKGYKEHGDLLLGKGKYNDAISYYREALKLKEDDSVAYNNLGFTYLLLGMPEESVPYLRKATEINPSFPLALNNMGVAFYKLGRFEEAVEYSSRALKLKPDFANAHNNVGISLVGLGRPQEAIKHLKEAVRLEPESRVLKKDLDDALLLKGGKGAL